MTFLVTRNFRAAYKTIPLAEIKAAAICALVTLLRFGLAAVLLFFMFLLHCPFRFPERGLRPVRTGVLGRSSPMYGSLMPQLYLCRPYSRKVLLRIPLVRQPISSPSLARRMPAPGQRAWIGNGICDALTFYSWSDNFRKGKPRAPAGHGWRLGCLVVLGDGETL